MRGRNKVYLLQLFLTTQSPSNLQTASPTATKVSFVPLWKWAKSFDLTTGGVLLRAAKRWAPHALFPGDCVRLACSWLPSWQEAPLLSLKHACQSQPYGGFSYRVSVLCINSYYVLVLFVLLESCVVFIFICLYLLLHSFPL